MNRLPLLLLAACLALAGCRTAGKHPEDEGDSSIREMRTEMIQQLRAAGASPAQIREAERQFDVLERQMKQMERQLKQAEKANE